MKDKSLARHKDLAIQLDGDVISKIVVVIEIGRDLSVNAKGWIQRAVVVIARQCEVDVPDWCAIHSCFPVRSTHEDLAVGLEGDGEAIVVIVAEGSSYFTAAAEGWVEVSSRGL